MTRSVSLSLVAVLAIAGSGTSFTLPDASTIRSHNFSPLHSTVSQEVPASPWFTDDENTNQSTQKLKTQFCNWERHLIEVNHTIQPAEITTLSNCLVGSRNNVPKSLDDIAGEWELVFTTVKHGIFRSSPFFLAVQEAFEYSEEKEAFGEDKATLFFKLHELQTCSWGASKIGRVAQRIDPKTGYLYSEFDTSIFSLTVIPILGWFKLLPTFGGCVVTASKAKLAVGGVLEMEVDYTTSRPVPGLQGLGEWIWSVKVPVGAVWKFLPWNKGRSADCSVTVKYVDEDFV
ncbi:hypothetical protein QTG54_014466 [Skeletonema marinoi]|uniref:Plastid lipid-associated protein/fibrillin conserved domain-containing protein n=1 Tax=Skeletonema marinoi TaxID=267567 RepID=A0AAD9D6F3_9STRA|nr:hypothetical protein QTG54_014466 [Skeletonema marinoi]